MRAPIAATLFSIAVVSQATGLTQGAAPQPPAAVPPPAIDCPLHGKNIDSRQLRPFENMERYIAFLERPGRAEWQRPDQVVEAMALRGDETVVDVGAGSGYFTFRIARVVAGGQVIAEDIEPEMIRHTHHRVMTEKIPNVTAVLRDPDDPGVPADADLVFARD